MLKNFWMNVNAYEKSRDQDSNKVVQTRRILKDDENLQEANPPLKENKHHGK